MCHTKTTTIIDCHIKLSFIFIAAHCVSTKHKHSNRKMQPHEIYVLFGKFNITTNSSETGSIKTNVSGIYIHPEWNIYSESFDADIAILILKKFIEFSEKIIPICLPPQIDEKSEQRDDMMGVVVGYGRSEEAKSHEIVPKKIEIPTISQTKCFLKNENLASLSSNRTFCAGLPQVTPCNGDSGGGFYIKPKSTYVIEGIVSTSIAEASGYCDPDQYVIFTHVSKHSKWIQEMTMKENIKIETWDPEQCDEDDNGYFTLMGPYGIIPTRPYRAHLTTFGFCDNSTIHVIMKLPKGAPKIQKFTPNYNRTEREISFDVSIVKLKNHDRVLNP